MHASLVNLTTPEECELVASNVEKRDPSLAQQARRRAVELRAERAGAKTEAEREALAAVYAYEAALSRQRGKKVRASRTWPMIARHGIIKAVERAVDRPDDTAGYRMLTEMGMQDLSFEKVVLRHPEAFSADVLTRCRKRLARYATVADGSRSV